MTPTLTAEQAVELAEARQIVATMALNRETSAHPLDDVAWAREGRALRMILAALPRASTEAPTPNTIRGRLTEEDIAWLESERADEATETGYETEHELLQQEARVARYDRLIAMARSRSDGASPIPMILHCPACGVQHIDAPTPCDMGVGCQEAGVCFAAAHGEPDRCGAWDNPPHRSHLCASCGHIWRPADVPTEGVAAITTRGAKDSPVGR
jgi:hypothetical protein